MPEQKSQDALPVTHADYQAPFQTEIWPCGAGGLNAKDQADAIPVGQFAKHTNLIHRQDRAVTVRDGLTSLATGGTAHHSVRRLNDPQNSTYTRLWGTDQALRIGQSGAVTQIDTGYSGDPLTLLPHRPPLSGDPWMFVADRSRMRKVRADGLVLPIGLPAPNAAPSLALGSESYTAIAGFDPGYFGADGTRATLWTPNKGYLFDEKTGAILVTDPPLGSPRTYQSGLPTMVDNGQFFAQPGDAATQANGGWYCFWGLAKSIDLSKVGSRTATDDDLMQVAIIFAQPWAVAEFRLYLVCSPNFDATQLPGQSSTGQNNTDFYVKIFRPSDLNPISTASSETTMTATRFQNLSDQQKQAVIDYAQAKGYGTTPAGINRAFLETEDPTRGLAIDAYAVSAFKYYGTVGIPLRRGDFKRYGTTANCGWNTITGLFLYYQLTDHVTGVTSFGILNWKLTGGSGPDTTDPGAQPYDYRYTHYDTRTGAEGNPSPEMTTANFLDAQRRPIVVSPAAYGDGSVRQRFYRRGGSLTADWYYVGQNSSDGGAFTDEDTDDGIVDAGTVNLDHYQAVPTVDDSGTTVLAQPLPVIFGPAQGLLFALGDPYRPGHLYWCIPDEPDHWPAESNVEVCSPSEELMAGLMYGAQPFIFSRERLYAVYPNLSGTTEVTVTTTSCKKGLVGRWAWTVGVGGIFGVARDCLFVTTGGAEQVLSSDIERLFIGQTWNGYAPIDFSFPTKIRLTIHRNTLYLHYQGTDGNTHVLAYSLLYKFWAPFEYGVQTCHLTDEEDNPIATLLVGGKTTGKSYYADPAAFSDDGTAITWTLKTGTWDLGRPREDKLLGDQILDMDPQGVAVTITNRLNNDSVVNTTLGFDNATTRSRYIVDAFGTTPQRARNLSIELTGSSTSARPILYFLGQSYILEPDVTINRATQWDDLGTPDEDYLSGVNFDCDTGGQTRTIVVEADYNGQIITVATLSVNTDGRHKVTYSWQGVQANKVRLRPNDDCLAWILYDVNWIFLPEPPRIATWDIHYEADGDQYYTGLDLFCDTGGLEKQIVVTVDGTTLTNAYTNEAFWRITANGRRWIHLTLPWGRGHVFHFHAIDANPGLLYKHKWYTEVEPSEQANWNQNFSIYGSRADKWLKALVLECDTFGVTKTVTVEADGQVVDTLAVNTNGRKVVQLTLSAQTLGRVWRMYPTDGNPGRLYSAQPVFDEEPFCLALWETQELDFDLPGFFTPLDAQITLKSSAAVTLTVSIYVNQLGTILTETYPIPSTGSVKDKRYVPFLAHKGVLVKFKLTSDDPFWLYQEESSVQILPWGSGKAILVHPFGNADVDRTRAMVQASAAAARSGGGSGA